MTQGNQIFREDEIELRSIILIILRRWWLIVGSVLIVGAGAWFTNPEPLGPIYESRVKLMLQPPVSEGLLNDETASSFSSRMSQDAFSSLATSNDLAQNMISSLSLADKTSGDPWPAERLSAMLSASVLVDGGGPGLPIITTVIQGGDPSQVKQIADTWVVEFTDHIQELFLSDAARFHEFVEHQYKQTDLELKSIGEARQKYQEDFSVAILLQNLSLKQESLGGFQALLISTTSQLGIKTSQHEEAIESYNQITVDGTWVGLDLNGRDDDLPLDLSAEGQSVIQAKEALYQARDDMQKFREENDVNFLVDKLTLQTSALVSDRQLLRNTKREYQAELARLQQIELEIESLPELLVTARALNDEALLQLLGIDPTIDDFERVHEISLLNEQVNPVYTNLTAQIISSRATVAAQEDTIAHLQSRIEKTEEETKTLQSEISNINNIGLPRLESRVQLAQRRYDMELARFISLEDDVASLRNEVINLRLIKDEYQALVDSYESDIRQVASSLPFIETRHEDLDNQFLQLRKRFDDLGMRLRLSEVAIQYDSGAILMLEAAVLPIVSLPSVAPGVNRALVGAAIGVVLGVMLAFAWQYLSPPNSTSKEPENS
jgi:capsular polysaccharide biosynthesis protein